MYIYIHRDHTIHMPCRAIHIIVMIIKLLTFFLNGLRFSVYNNANEGKVFDGKICMSYIILPEYVRTYTQPYYTQQYQLLQSSMPNISYKIQYFIQAKFKYN